MFKLKLKSGRKENTHNSSQKPTTKWYYEHPA